MNHTDDPMYIPERDMQLIGQASAGLADKLMWAYRLGRMQGLMESAQQTVVQLRADLDKTARRAGL